MSMKQTVLILALLCVSTFAMVPKHRFARDTDREICAEQTPCSWDIYKPPEKKVYMTVENTNCICAEDMSCVQDEDDTAATAFVYKCQSKAD